MNNFSESQRLSKEKALLEDEIKLAETNHKNEFEKLRQQIRSLQNELQCSQDIFNLIQAQHALEVPLY